MTAAGRTFLTPTAIWRNRSAFRQNLTVAVFLTAAIDPHIREADARTVPSSVLTR